MNQIYINRKFHARDCMCIDWVWVFFVDNCRNEIIHCRLNQACDELKVFIMLFLSLFSREFVSKKDGSEQYHQEAHTDQKKCFFLKNSELVDIHIFTLKADSISNKSNKRREDLMESLNQEQFNWFRKCTRQHQIVQAVYILFLVFFIQRKQLDTCFQQRDDSKL